MNTIDKLLKFIEHKKISKREFYLNTGLSNGFLDKSSHIGSDKIEKIISIYPDLSLDWLVLGKGEMILTPEMTPKVTPNAYKTKHSINLVGEKLEEYIKGENLRILPVTIDSEGNETIKYVPLTAHAGYLEGFMHPEFVEKLPNISISGFKNGTFRVFEIRGDSMEDTLQSSDRIISRYVEDFTKCRNNEVYVIITRTDGIVAKRVINRMNEDGGIVECWSDNEDYSMYTINAVEIMEMWHLQAVIRTTIKSKGSISAQISKLERKIAELKAKKEEK